MSLLLLKLDPLQTIHAHETKYAVKNALHHFLHMFRWIFFGNCYK